MTESIEKYFGEKITPEQKEKFRLYAEFLTEYNKKVNLTRITEPDDIVVKHFIDSVIILDFVDFPENSKLADIGTGAGFPGVPLKILRPDLQVTLIDSINKKVVFLQELLKILDTPCECVHANATELVKKTEYSKKYDFVTARAVANIEKLSKFCLPFLKKNGTFLALKGTSEEITNSQLKKLSAKIKNIHSYNLPNGDTRKLYEIIFS